MKYLSLFSGIGGFEKGIQQAYEELQNGESSRGLGQKESLSIRRVPNIISESNKRQYPTCIGYSEIDKYAIQIYKKHFPKHKNYGDITKIIASEIPDHDLLVGGFPCQSFSIAGKRGGFEDTRGTLFFNIAEIAQVKRPRLLLLENVKGLLSHDEGNTFATIISTLDELGYDCQWQVLNSKNYGVPQNRERVFIIGHLRGTSRPKVFPIRESNQVFDESHTKERAKEIQFTNFCGKAITPEGIADTITASYGELSGQSTKLLEITKNKSQGTRVYDPKGISPTLTGEGGGNVPIVIPVLTPNRLKKRQHGRRFKEDGDPSFTLTSQDKHGVFDGTKIRRLTPIECERLQGFPDGWTEGISDTQRYKTLGNAVTVNVIKTIMEKIV